MLYVHLLDFVKLSRYEAADDQPAGRRVR